MLLWFAVPTVLAVFAIFRDPALDYRLIAAGAVLPDIVDTLIPARVLVVHSVVVVVGLLVVIMLATIGRRLRRKQLLALPIGMFGHLVLDGAWLNTSMFWWPIIGGGRNRLPVLERGLVVGVVAELIGAVALVYFVRRLKLDTAARRRLFLHTGTLDPRLVDPQANPLRRGPQR